MPLFSSKKIHPISPSPGRRFLVNGLPKTGTHLAKKILQLSGIQPHPFTLGAYHADQAVMSWDKSRASSYGRAIEIGALHPKPIHELLLRQLLRSIPPGQVFNGHCTHTPGLSTLLHEEDIQVVSIIRDPRDVVVSLAEYLKKHDHPQHQNQSWNKCLATAIRGYGQIHESRVPAREERSWGDAWHAFLPWQDDNNTLVLHFEDLIGAKGGGSDPAQRDNIRKILHFIDKPASSAEKICENVFGGTRTFHVGGMGRWKEKFTPENIALFK
jgi:hypothetical protein